MMHICALRLLRFYYCTTLGQKQNNLIVVPTISCTRVLKGSHNDASHLDVKLKGTIGCLFTAANVPNAT